MDMKPGFSDVVGSEPKLRVRIDPPTIRFFENDESSSPKKFFSILSTLTFNLLVVWIGRNYLCLTSVASARLEKCRMGVRPDDSDRIINHSSPEVAKPIFPHERKQLLSDVAMAKAALSPDKIWWIHGNGYDLSRFVERHPGGKEAILLGRGRDCTALFESYHIFSKDHWYVGIVFVLAIC